MRLPRRPAWAAVLSLFIVMSLAPAVAADATATSGPRTLTVSRSADLDPAGDRIDVRGSGFDERKGIYVAFCVVHDEAVPPGPCGGGIDMSGTSGSSVWISSDPPPYGRGLAVPYGPGGSFAVTLAVSGRIGADTDCAIARCAVVTRNDHTRTAERGQDLAVALSFRPAGNPLLLAGAAGVALLAIGGVIGLVAFRRRRRRRAESTPVVA